MGAVRTGYLVAYNTACFFGWSWCLFLAVRAVAESSPLPVLWKELEAPLKLTQTAALLEIVHAALGLVKSPLFTTVQQVASRIFIVWGVLNAAPQLTTTQGVHVCEVGGTRFELNLITLLLAWGVTEVVRYSFYATKELGAMPYPILWLRYTTFLVLYPLGVASELALVWLALPHFKATGMWSYPMPNSLNMSFQYYWFCVLVSALYVPGFPPLYMYMLKQRSKVLSSSKHKAA